MWNPYYYSIVIKYSIQPTLSALIRDHNCRLLLTKNCQLSMNSRVIRSLFQTRNIQVKRAMKKCLIYYFVLPIQRSLNWKRRWSNYCSTIFVFTAALPGRLELFAYICFYVNSFWWTFASLLHYLSKICWRHVLNQTRKICKQMFRFEGFGYTWLD